MIERLSQYLPALEDWITGLLNSHKGRALFVKGFAFQRIPRFYSPQILETSKVVLVDKIPLPPLSDLGLTEFKNFESGDYAGITYLDTYFLKKGFEGSESLHFHELVHVLQWQILGLQKFLLLYGQGMLQYGYRESPLERMAFQLQERFDNSTTVFDVEVEVRKALKCIKESQ